MYHIKWYKERAIIVNVAFPMFYCIVNGGENSLSGDKGRLSGG